MRPEVFEILRCPETGKRLILENPVYSDGCVESGWLVSEGGEYRYPIRKFIPRFVPESNYANNFDMQWNKFSRTQLDSYSGHSISADRFWKTTGWRLEDVAGKWVLDVGCGAGRFAEVALEAGAKVVALDYSGAVDACYTNLKHHKDLHVVQGDIYALPFLRTFFPFVYSLGVLQHTPDVSRAFSALPPMLSDCGRLVVDVYQKSLLGMAIPKYWLRPITKRIPKDYLFQFLQVVVPVLFKLSCFFQIIPVAGSILKRLVPVANYTGILPLSSKQHLEWALLDTFDMLSPQYDHPQTPATLLYWFKRAGLYNIEIKKVGHLIGRGKRALR